MKTYRLTIALRKWLKQRMGASPSPEAIAVMVNFPLPSRFNRLETIHPHEYHQGDTAAFKGLQRSGRK